MASVAAAAIVFIAAAGVVIWMMLQGPLQKRSGHNTIGFCTDFGYYAACL
ncbi:MAG: hypothetical protein V8Q17_00980 [Acutalibacteraceae bacterium]